MNRNKYQALLWVLLVMLAIVPMSNAQSLFGTLSGTLTDPSGLVVPATDVLVRNESSGDIRRTTTNVDGFFNVTSLPAGSYAVVVEFQAKGFARTEVTGIALSGGDSRSVAVKLTMAKGSQTVQVNAATSIGLVSDTGERTSTISGKDLQSLAIVGRNAAEFLKILPGAMLTANGGQNGAAYTGENYGINALGAGGNQGGLGGTLLNGQTVDIAMDGAHTYDPGAIGSATPVNPNADMVAEVKVMTSNFSSENPQGPVVMNTITKSGGDQFHGEAYLYARNPVMNSNDWKRNHSNLPRANSVYYFPGGQIGGPVIIPKTGFNKNRNKLFFFNGFEYYKQTVDGGVDRAFVPTLAERNGDFSGAATSGVAAGKSTGVVPVSPITNTDRFGPCSVFNTDANGNKTTCKTVNPHPYDPLNTGNLALYPTYSNGVLTSAMDPGGLIVLNQYPLPNATPTPGTPFNYIAGRSVPQNEWQNIARIDFSFSDNTKLFARYSKQKESQVQPDGLWNGSGDNNVGAPSPVIGKNASDALAVSLMHVLSPSMTSETNFGYTYVDYPNSPTDPKKLYKSTYNYPYKGIFNTTKSMPVFSSWDGSIPSLGTPGSSYNPTMTAVKGIMNVGENFSKVFKTHSMKFGAYYETVYNKQDSWSQSVGTFAFNNANTLSGNVYADILSGWLGVNGTSYTEQVQSPPLNVGQKLLDFYAQDSWKATRRLTVEYGVRLQHMPRAYDKTGYGIAQFDLAKYSNDPSQLNNYTGVSWHKKTPSTPLSGVNSRLLFYSPRFGAAFDVFGDGRTVVRGGFGMYRRPDSVNTTYPNAISTSIGAITSNCGVNAYGPNSTPGGPSSTPGHPTQGTCNTFSEVDYQSTYHGNYSNPLGIGPSGGFIGITAVDKNQTQQPLTYSYSFTVAQTLPRNMTFELGYVGNQSRYGAAQINRNFVPLGAISPTAADTNADHYRPYRNYQGITEYFGIIPAEYDSMQASLTKQQGALSWSLNYTWSKSMAQNDSTPTLPNYGRKFFWGPSPNNRAHVLNASYSYHVPAVPHTPAVVGKGWQLSGITSLQSGPNLTSNHGINYGASGNMQTITGSPDWNNVYAKMTCDPRVGLVAHQYINGNCFRAANVGELPTGAFPYIAGPAYFNSDISVFKDIKIAERQNVQFRFEAFNFLNHPLYTFQSSDGNLQQNFSNQLLAGQTCDAHPGGYGCATQKQGKRIVELAVKYSF